MIPPERLNQICYCSCCCLSDGPEDSEMITYSPGETPWNRRIDCSCKWRWPYCLEVNAYGDYTGAAETYAKMIAMRARDCEMEIIATEVTRISETLGLLAKSRALNPG